MDSIYTFELYIDGNEDFYSEFAIEGKDNFESFHNIIIKSLHLSNNEMASFFVCNNKWEKEKEITLFDMKLDDESENMDYILTMRNTKIADVIDEKHRLMHYVYDFLNMKCFNIELMNITEKQDKKKYPLCLCCDNLKEDLVDTTADDIADIFNDMEDYSDDDDY